MERILSFLSVALLSQFVGPVMAQSSIGLAEAPDALIAAEWNNRLLVVCDLSPGTNALSLVDAQYEEAFGDWPGYIDRDLILVWISEDGIMSWKPVPNPDPNKAATLLIGGHDEDETELRKRVSCDTAYPLITLVGKDGGAKQTWKKPVKNRDIFQIIDAMPMRQQEMRGAADE